MNTTTKLAVIAGAATLGWMAYDNLVTPKPQISLTWEHDGKNLSGFAVWSSTNLVDWKIVAVLPPESRSYPIDKTNQQEFFKVSAR